MSLALLDQFSRQREAWEKRKRRIALTVADAESAEKYLVLFDSHKRLPALLRVWWQIPEKQRAAVLMNVWDSCDHVWEYRQPALVLFRECGYIGDIPRPASALRLYRGVSSDAHRRGLSWTSDLDVARMFVRGRWGAGTGSVYTVLAPPRSVLATFTSREESEYVLDPALYPRVRRCERHTSRGFADRDNATIVQVKAKP